MKNTLTKQSEPCPFNPLQFIHLSLDYSIVLRKREGVSERGISFPQMSEDPFRRTNKVWTTRLLSGQTNNDGSGRCIIFRHRGSSNLLMMPETGEL
jgi:hypothetical protein